MDFQGGIQWDDILKWVGIAFAAGFIGYFGRYLGMLLIDRMRRRRSQLPPAAKPEELTISKGTEPAKEEVPAAPETGSRTIELELEKGRAKIEKKKAKAEAKRLKKEKK